MTIISIDEIHLPNIKVKTNFYDTLTKLGLAPTLVHLMIDGVHYATNDVCISLQHPIDFITTNISIESITKAS